MAQENTRDIRQLLNNPALLYGMIKNSSKLATPFTLDSNYNIGTALYDNNGEVLRYVDRKLRVSSMLYEYDIAHGNLTGHEPFYIFGANADIDNTEETVWSVGGLYVPPTGVMQLEIVSTSNEDSSGEGGNPAGTGIRYVHLHYLSDTFEEKTDRIALDGTTVVTTNATDIYRIQEFHEDGVGTSKAAVGTIDLRNLANTPIYAEIAVGKNRAVQAFKTVPVGKCAYMRRINCGGGNQLGNRFMRFIISVTQNLDNVVTDGIWYDYGYFAVQDGNVDPMLDVPFKVNAGADIRINCISDSATANALVSTMLSGWIESI